MYKDCISSKQTKIPAQRTEDGHNVPLLAEELLAFDSRWEKESEFSSSPVTDCGDETKPFIGLPLASAFHGAVLLNQWCFPPYFPILCWSRSLCGMGHGTPRHILLFYSDTFPDFQTESPVNSALEDRTHCSTAAGRSRHGSPKSGSF